METYEHKEAGDQIRIETGTNPYFSRSKGLNPTQADDVLTTQMMQTVQGIPVPLSLQLTAGDVVALAGDYYTSAGWGLALQLPPRTGDVIQNNRQLFHKPVSEQETAAFQSAYADLASPTVKRQEIDRIYAVGTKQYIPFSSFLNSLAEQAVYAATVKNYGKKLSSNEAHFAPWSTRAYVVGHTAALQSAKLAYELKQVATGALVLDEASLQLQTIVNTAQQNPESFQLTDNGNVYEELSHRYHALAVQQDLFTMHFYSDHFAGGHLSRIGQLRQQMPAKFGVFGNILINSMHNEDNQDGVNVSNPFQPESSQRDTTPAAPFTMKRVKDDALGDGRYDNQANDENSNMLVNGMTNSLGDIAVVMQTGQVPQTPDFGGLPFLPEIDLTKRQTQPLLLQAANGQVYYRKHYQRIEVLSPSEYQQTLQDPASHGYAKLTYWDSIVLAAKSQVLGFIFSPKVVQPDATREASICRDEHTWALSKRGTSSAPLQTAAVATLRDETNQTTTQTSPPVIGLWRNTPAAKGVVPTLFSAPAPYATKTSPTHSTHPSALQ